MPFRRYAVYYLPEGSLAEFGAAWLGWDIRSGTKVPRLEGPRMPAPVHALTDAPRRYGLHATLKAPFRLAATSDEAALCDDVTRLAAALPAVQTGGLEPRRLSRFLALVPTGATAGLAELAATLVERLDGHRAPLSEDERARRGGLAPEEARLLERWGYPHVMARFRFHVTLTGPVSEAEGEDVLAALGPVLRPLCAPRFVLNEISLVGEGEDGMLRLIQCYPLSG